jgi:lipopolysaccharide transport protein LptA
MLVVLFTLMANAEKVEVTSKSFYAKDAEKEAHFIDDVRVKQGKSWIHSDELIVYFDDNNETVQYDAIGNCTFEIVKENAHFKGSADKLSYYPKQSKYLLAGNAITNDIIKNRQVKGNTIMVNTLTGDAVVKGNSNKPIKFIFDTGKTQ